MWIWMKRGWVAVRLAGITTTGGTGIPRCGCIVHEGLICAAGTVIPGNKAVRSLIFCATIIGSMPARCGIVFSRVKLSKGGVLMEQKEMSYPFSGWATRRVSFSCFSPEEVQRWAKQ